VAQGLVCVRPSDGPAAPPRRESGTSQPSYPPAAMVGWYRPIQIARTGLSTLISTLFGRNADERVIEALKAAPLPYFDYAEDDAGEPRAELWLDYVADAGDGFDSTYAVASAVAASTLKLADPADPHGPGHHTERGRILVFGGDTVYPVASRAQYEQRLVMPYEHALPRSGAPHPDVYAIPGNHDWYDSLVAFSRRFCSQRWFAGWRTQQRVSYFALRLPQRWWLIGTDVQLDSDIDADQVAYFKAVADKLGPDDRLILCNAEPHWIYQKKYGTAQPALSDSNLRFLEDRVFNREISVTLAGDLHHYRHHHDGHDHHKIVAGGGGAFLHPTHDADVDVLPGAAPQRPFRLACSYPKPADSRALTKRNLLFPWLSPQLGVLTGLLYLLTCRAFAAPVSGLGLGELGQATYLVVCEALRGPTTLLWLVILIGGVILFTDTHSKPYRYLGGGCHALAHLICVFFVAWGAAWLVARWQLAEAPTLLASGALVFAGGWLVGSLVLGAYLYVSLNLFGRHDNEAFSSLAIPDWKNFLRLHIAADGALRIYPIGIDRVPRRWRRAAHGPRLVAADDHPASRPHLIEPPIRVPAKERP
jgi:hypothetical protein